MTYITRGIVIGKEPSGDFDYKYVIYTKNFGKVNALAKGVKKTTSKLSSHLDFFASIDLMLAKGLNFYRIAGARISDSRKSIRFNLSKTAAGLIFSEALNNLMVYDFIDYRVFEISEAFFRDIDLARDIKEVFKQLNKRLFELLSHLGYQPSIKSLNQRQLTFDLCFSIINITDKDLKSYNFWYQLFN